MPAPTPDIPLSPTETQKPIWQDIGIVDLNAQGEGVGRHEGQVIFIPLTIPGEIIDAEVIAKRPSFARGRVTNLRLTAPTRVTPKCQHFGTCGGCQYQHIAYPAQPEIVAESVLGNLRKLLKGWDIPTPVVEACSQGYGYRSQARLQFKRQGDIYLLGYTADEGDLIDIQECPVLAPVLQQLLVRARSWMQQPGVHEQLRALDMRHLTLQSNAAGTQAGLLFHTFELLNLRRAIALDKWDAWWHELREAVPELVALVIDNGQTDEGFGQNYTEETGQLMPVVPMGAFKQNNPYIEEAAYRRVLQWINPRPGENGLDAYCGRGELTARLAQRVGNGQVIGVESAPTWFERRQHINLQFLDPELSIHVRFIQQTVEQHLASQSPSVDFAIFNPPRKGMEPAVVDWLKDYHNGRWTYLSCNAATFARDCQPLAEKFRLTRLAIFDMFPQTAKMELLAHFEPR